MERLLTEAQVDPAVHDPPTDTRAYFRGRCLESTPRRSGRFLGPVIFDLGRESLQLVPTLEPLRGTQAHVGPLLERSATPPRSTRSAP